MKDFCKRLKNPKGDVIGLWVANPDDQHLKEFVEEFNATEGLPVNIFEEFKETKYRTVPNRFNKDGGAFLMFGGSLAPGESDAELPPSTQGVINNPFLTTCPKCKKLGAHSIRCPIAIAARSRMGTTFGFAALLPALIFIAVKCSLLGSRNISLLWASLGLSGLVIGMICKTGDMLFPIFAWIAQATKPQHTVAIPLIVALTSYCLYFTGLTHNLTGSHDDTDEIFNPILGLFVVPYFLLLLFCILYRFLIPRRDA